VKGLALGVAGSVELEDVGVSGIEGSEWMLSERVRFEFFILVADCIENGT
jgi:hypothetical protein